MATSKNPKTQANKHKATNKHKLGWPTTYACVSVVSAAMRRPGGASPPSTKRWKQDASASRHMINAYITLLKTT
jgi:hypothetical protein